MLSNSADSHSQLPSSPSRFSFRRIPFIDLARRLDNSVANDASSGASDFSSTSPPSVSLDADHIQQADSEHEFRSLSIPPNRVGGSHAPPSYASTTADSVPPYTGYSQSSRHGRLSFMEHKFHFKDRGKNWATLRLVSRTPLPGSQAKAPRFIGGDDVRGVIELDFNQRISIQSVSLRLTGKMIASYLNNSTQDKGDYVFLDYTHQICSKTTSRIHSCSQILDGKMQGPQSFPFSFKFPIATSLGSGKNGRPVITDCPIPQTFLEKGVNASIKYELSLVVVHGKLRLDSKLYTPVTYMPKIIPPPASEGRQSAYREGGPLPNPLHDPEGWHPCPRFAVEGRFDNAFDAEVRCTLFLAQPLSYVRGTVIPCYLNFSSSETRCLDVVAEPNAIDIRLVRRIKHYTDVNRALNYHNPNITRDENMRTVGKAVWWSPSQEVRQGANERWMEGEIHLSKDLQPSCGFIPFTIEYAVQFMPFEADMFTLKTISSQVDKTPESARHAKPLQSHNIQIASFHQYGSLPTAFSARRPERDFRNAEPDLGVASGAKVALASFPLRL